VKKIFFLLALIPLMLSAAMMTVNTLAELATGTWCGWCPYAYDGLEVMKDKYPVSDLVCIRYYNASGDLSNAEADARDDYYGVSGYPSCFFNGTVRVGGGGATTADGSRYDPVISKILMGDVTPFTIDVELDVGGGQATATATVRLHDDYSGAAPKLWIALTEDDIDEEITNATRRVVDAGDVSITGEGQDETMEETFTVEPGWTAGNLHAVAFLQIHSTKEILQVSSSYPQPDYHFRLNMEGPRIGRISTTSSFSTSFFITNVGLMSDDFTVTLDEAGLPSGWSADLTEPAMFTSTSLDPGAQASYAVEVDANGNPGQGVLVIRVSSGDGEEQEIPVHVLTNTADFNIVDDDVGKDYETYITAALDALGETYAVWDCSFGPFSLENLSAATTPVLIWCTGDDYETALEAGDQALLKSYLDGGGKLFLTGQNIGYHLAGPDSDWQSKTFYHDYIHANYIHFNAEDSSISGISGDPITAGMSFRIDGGDGASNQAFPSKIEPRDADATTIFEYSTGDVAGIRTESGVYKLVYLAFGYEAIDNAADRRDLLEKALDWLGSASSTDIEDVDLAVNPGLVIASISGDLVMASYRLPGSNGFLDVYDATGRRITSRKLTEPEGEVGLSLSHLPVGCYFLQLRTDYVIESLKMILVR